MVLPAVGGDDHSLLLFMMVWDMHPTFPTFPPKSQPGAEGNGRSFGSYPQLMWPACGSWSQDRADKGVGWMGPQEPGSRYQGLRTSLRREWEGRQGSKLWTHIPLSYWTSFTKHTFKDRITENFIWHSIKPQAGSPHATALFTCLWSQPWFWVRLSLRWKSSILFRPQSLLLSHGLSSILIKFHAIFSAWIVLFYFCVFHPSCQDYSFSIFAHSNLTLPSHDIRKESWLLLFEKKTYTEQTRNYTEGYI